jgi:hypothetical protein
MTPAAEQHGPNPLWPTPHARVRCARTVAGTVEAASVFPLVGANGLVQANGLQLMERRGVLQRSVASRLCGFGCRRAARMLAGICQA